MKKSKKSMARTQAQIDREAALLAKQAANVASGANPALTAAERAELTELQNLAR